MFFKHNIKFEIEGLNLEKCINNLIKNKIQLKNIKKNQKNASFIIDKKHKKYVKNELLKNNIKINSLKSFGFVFFIKKLLNRYGLMAGFIFSILSLIFSQLFILKIEVYGLENLNKNEIISVLKTSGYNGIALKKDIDLSAVENLILYKIDNVSLCSAISKGTSLVINIKEKIINDEYQNVGNFKPIISGFNGRIKSIKLKQGTLNVKVGDLVKKGDVLVFPYIIDSSGKEKSVKAEADIMAEIWLEGKVVHNEQFLETKKTGKKVDIVDVYFNNIPIYLSKNKVNFKEFVVEESCKYLSTSLLPLKIKKKTIYETITQEKTVSFETVKDEVIAKAKQLAESKFQNANILSESYNIYNKGSAIEVVYVVTKEINLTSLQ